MNYRRFFFPDIQQSCKGLKSYHSVFFLKILLIIFVSLFVGGCKSQNNNDLLSNPLATFLVLTGSGLFGPTSAEPTLNSKLNVDLGLIKGLMISAGSSSISSLNASRTEGISIKAGGITGSELYAMDDSNFFETLQLFSSDSDTTVDESSVSYYPHYIKQLDNYILFSLSFEAPCTLVLARISDNALFCAAGSDNGQIFVPNGFFHMDLNGQKDYSRDFQVDNSGNVYLNGVLASDYSDISYANIKLYKLTISDPENPQINLILNPAIYGSLDNFRVDPVTENIMFRVDDSDGYPRIYFRFPSGHIEDAGAFLSTRWGSGSNGGCLYAACNFANWDLSPTNTFYLFGGPGVPSFSDVGTPEMVARFFTLIPDMAGETLSAGMNNDVLFDLVDSTETANEWTRITYISTFSHSENNRCHTSSYSYWGAWGDPSLTRYDTETPEGAIVDLRATSIGYPKKMLCIDSQVIIHGSVSTTQDRILVFDETEADLVHPSITNLLPLTYNYTVTDMNLQSDGTVMIGAKDNDTGNDIIAVLDPASPETINILSSSAPETTEIVPVN